VFYVLLSAREINLVWNCQAILSAEQLTRAKTMELERVCSRCGTINRADAKYCETCAAPLDAAKESDAQFVEDDLALRHVDPNNRLELDRFQRWDDAELACGLLRFNNIACELSPMPLPGLPGDIILWVHNADAQLAWALLADAEREASRKRDNSA
jgi:hypothetical protein